MVRAQKRKKAPVIPFTKGEQGAKIEWEAFDALKKRHKISENAANCDGVDSVHGIVQRMLGDMENQPSTAQIKVVQEMKGKLRVAMQKLLTNTDIINDEILYALAAMLRLYLQPQSFPIRKATEWIIESLKFFEQRSGQQVAVCMQCVCKDFVREYGEWKTALDKSSIPLETCMNWALTFNSIAYLNKELPFLMVKSADAHDDSLVTIVVESVMILFDMLAVHVVEAASSVIAMRFAECCAACLKVTSSLCKVVVSEGKTVIHRIDSAVIDRSISLCTILLPSDLINKVLIMRTLR